MLAWPRNVTADRRQPKEGHRRDILPATADFLLSAVFHIKGQALKTIGPNGVLVPSATWKAVYDPTSGGAGAYVCSNNAAPRCGTMSIAMLAGTLGIDPFPALPNSVKGAMMTLPRPEASPYARGRASR
jgi:hypothetical protein